MLKNDIILAADGIVVAVSHYAPLERHAAHADRYSRISFLLEGGYREDGHTGSLRMRPGDVLIKSRRAKHEDQFSDGGARIASIEFTVDDPFDDAPDPQLWRRRTDAFALRHVSDFLHAARVGDVAGASAAGIDLVTASAGEEGRPRCAPSWLQELKEQLEEFSLASIKVAARARAIGAHPAHVSRLFRRCYGTSLSEHANAHSVRRAIGQLARPDMSLCDVALATGFCDQSHMNRIFRRVTGRTPGATRSLLAGLRG